MPTIEQQKHWVAQGIKFGYPVCCIVAFCALEHLQDKEPRQLEGTGYVPCSACNTNLGMMQMIVHINLQRDRSLPPFPNYDM